MVIQKDQALWDAGQGTPHYIVVKFDETAIVLHVTFPSPHSFDEYHCSRVSAQKRFNDTSINLHSFLKYAMVINKKVGMVADDNNGILMRPNILQQFRNTLIELRYFNCRVERQAVHYPGRCQVVSGIDILLWFVQILWRPMYISTAHNSVICHIHLSWERIPKEIKSSALHALSVSVNIMVDSTHHIKIAAILKKTNGWTLFPQALFIQRLAIWQLVRPGLAYK